MAWKDLQSILGLLYDLFILSKWILYVFKQAEWNQEFVLAQQSPMWLPLCQPCLASFFFTVLYITFYKYLDLKNLACVNNV